MSANNCDKCRGTRWLYRKARWQQQTDSLISELWPFARDGWQLCSQLELSAALASKVLVACDKCNPQRLAPWSKHWQAGGATPMPAEADQTPF